MMKYLLFFLIFFICFNVSGQTLSAKQQQSDFDYLQAALEEAHGGLYRHHSKPEIARFFVKHRQQLNQPKSHLEFYGQLCKLLANIGDGHMKLEYSGPAPSPLLFPYRLLISNNTATILSNDTKTDTVIKPGMRLVSINNQSLKAIKKDILPFLIGDGFIQTGKANSLQRNFSQYYKVFFDTTSFFSIKVRDFSGKIISVRTSGIKNAEREINRRQNPVNAKVLTLTKSIEGNSANVSVNFTGDGIAHLQIRYFVGDRFKEEIDSLFSLIIKQNTKALVLDLRGNGGGLDEYGAYTAAKFVAEPFRYLDHIYTRILIPSRADWKSKPPVDLVNGTAPKLYGGYSVKPMLNNALTLQLPSSHPFTGKLIILIDGKTFSAASDFSAIMSNISNAVFVGVETGGGYQGNTSGLNEIVTLPNSKFKVNIHLWDYWSAVLPPKLKSRGVIPNHKIEQKSTDWLNGVDTQLEFALKLCKQY